MEAAALMNSERSIMGATNVQATESKPATSLGANDVAVAAEDASVDASVDALWVRKWDDASNSLFYFNLRTQESSWEQPEAYKAVFMSEPLDLDSEKAPDDKKTEEIHQEQQSGASVTIQSLYRGRKDRERVKEAKKWTQQFDPATAQKYYYNSETGESQWEKPMDLLTGVKDERSARAVKIQSVFRAKKARDRVKQLADEEEEEEQLEQQLQEETVAAEEEMTVEEPCSRPLWSEYFDPRSGKYYYRHATTGAIIWDKPEDFVSSKAEGSKRDVAALSIQCAARKRIAANNLAAKREKLRVLTDLSTMQLKLGELKQVSLEIQMEIEARALVSTEEEKRFPHLASLVLGWRESLESIKNHVASLENRGDDILLAECLAARVVHAERFHKALAEMRSECLALLRSILLMNSYFVDLDVSRINVACTTFAKWKAHEVCALRDSRMLEIVQGSEISQLLEQAEALLRRSMGLTDFNNGFTSTTGKRYEDWHPSVTAALVGVQEMEERLTRKIQLLRGFRAAEARKREVSQMAEEDLLACRLAQQRRRRLNDKVDYATFLVKCQECWQKGLNQREEDLYAIAARGSAKMQQRTKRHEGPQSNPTNDSDLDSKSKLSIWEATKEGLPVEVVCTMVFAEMQKARRLGYDFMVRTARSDHGETLIQIACWWGHEHLVKFFLEEGARIDSIDSTCNRFSLLHDAARRGHSRVIRILLENGLACNVADSAGDTPLHWAARKNNFSAVVTLLGVYLAERDKALADEILKAVRHKNLRGKTAYALAKGDRVRLVLKSAEEGRLPPLRRPRTADRKPAPSGISRRMTEVAPRDRTRGNRSPTKGKAVTILTKPTKHASSLALVSL
ncbi:Ankyrin-2 [Phytophthora ramorum]|uniref:Ankyrin-2 n=1 Tax=Phytophthora ramorum TaxID=164328 RepID=UPI0030957F22|nr:Ankyrin-2 [Phytophthora ramorum]